MVGTINQRKDVRHEISFSACIIGDGLNREGVLKDISMGGAKVLLNGDVKANTHITLSIGGIGDILGLVAWSGGGALGIRFQDSTEKVGRFVYDMAMYGATTALGTGSVAVV